MSELLSLSVLQLFSVFSLLTSVLAVLCVGGSIHRPFAPKPAHVVVHPPSPMSIGSGKQYLWNWSTLPVSFSLGALIGEDGHGEAERGVGTYTGGTDLIRMDWQVGSRQQQRPVSPLYESQVPLSMAKLIMSRHTKRRPTRRMPGMSRPATPSRLAQVAI